MSDRAPTCNNGLGVASVKGRIRLPSPAAKIIAFMGWLLPMQQSDTKAAVGRAAKPHPQSRPEIDQSLRHVDDIETAHPPGTPALKEDHPSTRIWHRAAPVLRKC